jgi:hypothetical protein
MSEDAIPKSGIIKDVSETFKNLAGIPGDIASGGIKSIISVIFMILKGIMSFLYILFVYVVPFLVKYIGIPLFILGILMALLFFGGHLFFTIALMVGVFLYVKGLYKLTINLPKQAKGIGNSITSTNNGYKVKM